MAAYTIETYVLRYNLDQTALRVIFHHQVGGNLKM